MLPDPVQNGVVNSNFHSKQNYCGSKAKFPQFTYPQVIGIGLANQYTQDGKAQGRIIEADILLKKIFDFVFQKRVPQPCTEAESGIIPPGFLRQPEMPEDNDIDSG